MSSLEKLIRDEIHAEGLMTVARFMELALYHPRHGYYRAGPPRSGWRGHYLTSPEIDPAFGELWAGGFEQLWAAAGRPEHFDVVEVGPGEGGFAAAVLGAVRGEFAAALSYVLVERSDSLRQRQADRLRDSVQVAWTESLDQQPRRTGCVFANEVLDNLPVHVVEGRGADVLEVVVRAGAGGLEATLAPPGADVRAWLERNRVDLPDGHRLEVGLAAEALVTAAADVIERGAIVLCDYGLTTDQAATRPAGTLTCYSEAGADDAWLERPGDKDITAHVNWTVLGDKLRAVGLNVGPVFTQRTALRKLGSDSLHDRLRAASTRGGRDAVRALSHRQALGILADPGGLGGLGVLVGLRGIDPPPFLAQE